MKRRFLASVLAALTLAATLTGCGGSSSSSAGGSTAAPAASGTSGASGTPEYTWKMHLNSTEGDNAYDKGALFAEKVGELTDGRV